VENPQRQILTNLNVMPKKQYYIEFNIDTQKYEVIDCTHPQQQPVIKEYKQAAAADKFLHNLRLNK